MQEAPLLIGKRHQKHTTTTTICYRSGVLSNHKCQKPINLNPIKKHLLHAGFGAEV